MSRQGGVAQQGAVPTTGVKGGRGVGDHWDQFGPRGLMEVGSGGGVALGRRGHRWELLIRSGGMWWLSEQGGASSSPAFPALPRWLLIASETWRSNGPSCPASARTCCHSKEETEVCIFPNAPSEEEEQNPRGLCLRSR